MPDRTVPAPPRQSPLGWPLVDRREEFRVLEETSDLGTYRIANFQGQPSITRPILRVPCNLPKYRIANGRTASAQQEFVATRGLPEAFFDDGDPELEEIQAAQHQLLLGMIGDEGLQRKFADTKNKQVDPLLLDENGFVVNGNRRLCCWRKLYQEDPATYAHFGHVDVVVLPHCDEREIDSLEAALQVEQDIRSDYVWHAEANMIAQKQRLHNLTTPELSRLYKKSKKAIETLLAKRQLAIEYLEQKGTPFKWSDVSEADYTLDSLIKAMRALPNQGDKELVKRITYTLIGNADEAEDRLYRIVTQVKDHLPAVREQLAEAFPVAGAAADAAAVEAFGGLPAAGGGDAADSLRLVAVIGQDADAQRRAREIVLEAVQAQEEQARDRDTAEFLLTALKKANNHVQNASGHGLRPESEITGVAAQIQAIKRELERIEAWLASRGA
jgi:hypothetical protein